MMELQRPLRVAGDIKITFFDKHGAGKVSRKLDGVAKRTAVFFLYKHR